MLVYLRHWLLHREAANPAGLAESPLCDQSEGRKAQPKQGTSAVASLGGGSPFQLVQEASTARSCRYHRGVGLTPLNTNDKKVRHMEQGDNAQRYRARCGADPRGR